MRNSAPTVQHWAGLWRTLRSGLEGPQQGITLRGLATTGRKRSPMFPDMPTIGESYPDFLVTSWNGFLAPAGTPQPVVRLLARETRNAAKDAGIADRLLKLGIEPSGADPDEFAEVIRAERDFYRAAAAAAGIKME